MSSEERRVFVLGAGFTKAFLPSAPRMIDDYGALALQEKFEGFDHAWRILDIERTREANGLIDIERLMTRLDGRMPYDFDLKADEELGMLLIELKKAFMRRIEEAREEPGFIDELNAFARYCVHNHITCITLNYDDVLDEALFKVSQGGDRPNKLYWDPDGGYGFFCKSSVSCVEDRSTVMDLDNSMLLLKLHGSMNWRPKRGYPRPYSVDAIVHHESWYYPEEDEALTEQAISLHIEPEPFIVFPVLMKSAIVEQPVLRIVWYQAYRELLRATHVTFVGYSMPTTDIAVSTLFFETLRTYPTSNINIINLASTKGEKEEIIRSYRKFFKNISEEQFYFKGALDWWRDFAAGSG